MKRILLYLVVAYPVFRVCALVFANDRDMPESVITLIFEDSASPDGESEPLSPRDYFPLGIGIRKDRNTSLVPFCIAIHRTEKNCVLAQYFELEFGTVMEADRVMNVDYGAPSTEAPRSGGNFHGRSVGKPFTGYVFSGGGFKSFVQDQIGSTKIPKAKSFRDVERMDFFAGSAAAMTLFTAFGTGFIASMFNKPEPGSPNMTNFGWGAVAGAAAPHLVAMGISLHSKAQVARIKKMLRRKEARLFDAFTASKRTSENWTFVSGKKVSSKTYDAFVEFLDSTVQ